MFGKSSKQKKSTGKLGNIDDVGPTNLVSYITIAELDISVPLENKITIGREVGDLLVDHTCVAPRHCTFYLNQDVICVMDHSSESGTYVNKKKIIPGKMFILGDKDKLKIGELVLTIEAHEVPVVKEFTATQMEVPAREEEKVEDSFEDVDTTGELELGPEVPEVTSEMKLDSTSELEMEATTQESEEDLIDEVPLSDDADIEKANDEDLENVELDESILPEEVYAKHNPKIKEDKASKISSKKSPVKNKVKSSFSRDPSAGIITRIFSCLFDMLICVIILEIFMVYVDFSMLYREIPISIMEEVKPLYLSFVEPHYLELVKLIPQIGKAVEDILKLEKLPDILKFITFYFIYRLVVGFLFGRTIGQIFMGIKFEGRFVTKRLILPVRETLGVLTFPFIIFDLPAFISKRTFKEVLTLSQYLRPSKTRAVFSIAFFTPLLVVLYCFSPLVKGLSIPSYVEVADEMGKVRPVDYKDSRRSSVLGLEFDKKEGVEALPHFSIQMVRKKRILKSGLLFLDLKAGSSLKVEKIKGFKMLSIYNDFVKLNPLSKYFQPKIFNLVNDVALNNKNFKFELKDREAIISETKGIFSSAFALQISSIDKFILNNGILYSGFRDFREKVENLYSTSVSKISFINLGNIPGAMSEHNIGKNKEYSFITLGDLDSVMYSSTENFTNRKSIKITRSFRLTSDEGEELLEDSASQFIKYINDDNAKMDAKLNQVIYKKYFLCVKELLEQSRFVALEKLMKNIQTLLSVLEEKGKLKNKKLFQNMTELLEAIKGQDYRFFNITKNKTV